MPGTAKHVWCRSPRAAAPLVPQNLLQQGGPGSVESLSQHLHEDQGTGSARHAQGGGWRGLEIRQQTQHGGVGRGDPLPSPLKWPGPVGQHCPAMERTTVLITGCSSGIGLGLAARLAADATRRFKVYATMRDLAKGERLLERLGGCCPDTLEVLQLDVTDPRSLAAAAQRVQGQRLDVLGLPFNAVYCASKFAVEGLCESLAIVLRPFNIHLTLVECGPVHTSFLANLQRPDPEGSEMRGLDAATQGLYRRYLWHCQSIFRDAAQEVEEVLPVFLEAIGSPCPPLRCASTQLLAPLWPLRLSSPDGSAYVRAMHDFVFGGSEAGGDQP
ncbi:17-beta-hydroxysteroid dehydrogenase type 1 isoform 2-T2 [Cyanocitta cristata]